QAVYRKVETEMIGLMEPVIRFLDYVDDESTHVRNGGDPGPLLEALDTDETTLFAALETLGDKRGKNVSRPFKHPARVPLKEPESTTQSIQFTRSKDEIEILKDFFDVRSGKAAGEHAWDFVFEVEDL